MPMRVWVNGEALDAPEQANLARFLAGLGIDPAKVAVERNRAIVPRSQYQATMLAEGDRLEIVQFVGGG
jgi:thiamine biosynthesis protein ThiS